MVGITNKDPREEQARQEIVEHNKAELPPEDMAVTEHGPVGKNKANEPESRGRVAETGAGRGLEHEGH